MALNPIGGFSYLLCCESCSENGRISLEMKKSMTVLLKQMLLFLASVRMTAYLFHANSEVKGLVAAPC